MYGRLFTPGVAYVDNTAAWQVTQRGAGANMSVDIATGSGNIALSSSSYPYWGFSDATNNQTVTASDPSNPRKDIVVAYVDLAVVDSTTANNPGALKFAVVAGTPTGSPSDPSDATIQAAVSAGNPWIKLARITVAAGASSITNAAITDLRQPIAWKGRLWGGSSNTNGHTVPNAADDTVTLNAATQSLTNKSLDSTNTLTAPVFRNIDAWVDANESWAYASSTTITVPTDATTKYDIGDYIKITQSSTVYYFVITGVTSTVLTVAGLQGATVANSAISSPYYSKGRNPHNIGLKGGIPYNPYKFSVYRAAALNSPSSLSAVVQFDTKNFDTSNNVDVTTNKGRFTAPINGFYFFTANITLGPTGTPIFITLIYKNGTTQIGRGVDRRDATTNKGGPVSALVQLTAGDYVEAYLYTNSAVAIDVTTPSNNQFEGFLVSAL